MSEIFEHNHPSRFRPNPDYVPYSPDVRAAYQDVTARFMRTGLHTYYFNTVEETIRDKREKFVEPRTTAEYFWREAGETALKIAELGLNPEMGFAFECWDLRRPAKLLIDTAAEANIKSKLEELSRSFGVNPDPDEVKIHRFDFHSGTVHELLDANLLVGRYTKNQGLVIAETIPAEQHEAIQETFQAQLDIPWWP